MSEHKESRENPRFRDTPDGTDRHTDTRQFEVESSATAIELNVGKPEHGGESLPLRPPVVSADPFCGGARNAPHDLSAEPF